MKWREDEREVVWWDEKNRFLLNEYLNYNVKLKVMLEIDWLDYCKIRNFKCMCMIFMCYYVMCVFFIMFDELLVFRFFFSIVGMSFDIF